MKNKNCQRCTSEFVCQADNIAACGCAQIVLEQATKDYLAKTNYDCLCNNCLTALNNICIEQNASSSKELIENKHFYTENGLMVFKEAYHISRGYCCKSNCRHCAYGFRFK